MSEPIDFRRVIEEKTKEHGIDLKHQFGWL